MSTFTDTQAALAICLAAKQPVVLWGDPGEGKTASIEAIAESQGKLMETVIASIREPSDFAGLPNIVDGRTTMVPPDWALNVAEHDGPAGRFERALLAVVPLEHIVITSYLGHFLVLIVR